jgi:membrane protein YqaA with SNARE-associated domain
MKLLVRLYDKTLEWSHHKHAAYYLALVSFIEASFFPVPPYLMLAPMALAKPQKAIDYALLAAVASVLGATLGYALGLYVFKPLIAPLLDTFGYSVVYEKLLGMMQERGAWAVLIAGFMPIPFKLIAIAAGFLQLNLFYFVLASFAGRGSKFMIIALLMKFGGDRMEQQFRKALDKSGILLVMMLTGILGMKYLGVV